MESLRSLGRTMAKVVRDGELLEIPAEEMVPGDMVRLEARPNRSSSSRL